MSIINSGPIVSSMLANDGSSKEGSFMRHSPLVRWIAGSAIALATLFVGAGGVQAANDNNIAATNVQLSSATAGATNVTMTISATVGAAIASGETLFVNVEATCGVEPACRFGTTSATLGWLRVP